MSASEDATLARGLRPSASTRPPPPGPPLPDFSAITIPQAQSWSSSRPPAHPKSRVGGRLRCLHRPLSTGRSGFRTKSRPIPSYERARIPSRSGAAQPDPLTTPGTLFLWGKSTARPKPRRPELMVDVRRLLDRKSVVVCWRSSFVLVVCTCDDTLPSLFSHLPDFRF